MVVEKFSIVRMNRYQLKPFGDSGASLHTVVSQQQETKQKNNNTTQTTTTSQLNKLIGLSELAERIKALGTNTSINSDLNKLFTNNNQQNYQLLLDEKQKEVRDSEHQILGSVSLIGDKQIVRDRIDGDKVQRLNIAEYQSIDTANEDGLKSTISPQPNHKGHHKNTEKVGEEDHTTNNKTEGMMKMSVSSVPLNNKRKHSNTVVSKNNLFKGVDQGNFNNTSQSFQQQQQHHQKQHQANSNNNSKTDLGYMTCSSKETLSEIDEEMESDIDEEIESDNDADGEHFFNVRRINSRKNINFKNSNRISSTTSAIDYECYNKTSLEKCAEQLIRFSTSPFVLNKTKGRSKDLRSTLKSDMTISGRNPVDIANENHAKKDRALSADCTLRSFRFTIEKRRVVSISKDSVVANTTPSPIKRDVQDMCNNKHKNENNDNNSGENIDSSSCMQPIKTLSNKKTANDQNKDSQSNDSSMSLTKADIRNENNNQRALDAQAYMYLGLATARSCRNRRRRHSFDHIRSHRQQRSQLQRCQGRFLGALVARSRGSDHFSDGDEEDTTIHNLIGSRGMKVFLFFFIIFSSSSFHIGIFPTPRERGKLTYNSNIFGQDCRKDF